MAFPNVTCQNQAQWMLRDGSVRLRDGSVSLRDGSVRLRDGSVRLRDGSVSLRDGSVRLRDGSVRLSVKLSVKILLNCLSLSDCCEVLFFILFVL